MENEGVKDVGLMIPIFRQVVIATSYHKAFQTVSSPTKERGHGDQNGINPNDNNRHDSFAGADAVSGNTFDDQVVTIKTYNHHGPYGDST